MPWLYVCSSATCPMGRPRQICARISPASARPSQIVIPVDRETGRPRGFAFVEFLDRAMAEQAIDALQPAALHGPLALGERGAAREKRGGGGVRRLPSRAAAAAASAVRRPRAAAASADRVRRRRLQRRGRAASGGVRPGGPRGRRGNRNFGPPKKKSASSEKRWENKERGPKGPIKERYTGRLGGLYDDPDDARRDAAGRTSTTSRRRAPEDEDERMSGSPGSNGLDHDTSRSSAAILSIVLGVLWPLVRHCSCSSSLRFMLLVGVAVRAGLRRRRRPGRAPSARPMLGLAGVGADDRSARLRRRRHLSAGMGPARSSSRWARILGIVLAAIALIRIPLGTAVRDLRADHPVQERHRSAVRARVVARQISEPADRARGAGAPADGPARREAERVEIPVLRSASTSAPSSVDTSVPERTDRDERRRACPARTRPRSESRDKPRRPSVQVLPPSLVTATLSTASASFA